MEKLIKSKERVRDYAEVFTPMHVVKDMCDLVSEQTYDIHATFFEPACGTGNFLSEILTRKLSVCKTVDDGLDALLSLYGIDIQEDNVHETRIRLLKQFIERFPMVSESVIACANIVLVHNIVRHNVLELTEQDIQRWKDGGLLPYYGGAT